MCHSHSTFLELYTDLVFLVSIGQYFLGIYHTVTKGKFGWYIPVSKLWPEPPFPFSLKRGAFPPFRGFSPPFEDKGGSRRNLRSSC